MPPSPFGLYLRARRLAAGLSLRRVAEAIGVSHVFLGEVERGRVRVLPSRHWDALIAAVPGVDRAELARLADHSVPLSVDPLEMSAHEFDLAFALARRIREQGLDRDQTRRILNVLTGGEE
ncbi:MAG: helix-turn-helix domain-containing protein [Alphaproteobacteria bacterium]|nr:helix-turn-helix domain-containing protein [Alphaproteobacteria bacterium]